VLGVAIIAAGYYYETWWGAIGVVPLFTAALGYCPVYSLVGISTCPIKDAGTPAPSDPTKGATPTA
jgi:hypothetical protein